MYGKYLTKAKVFEGIHDCLDPKKLGWNTWTYRNRNGDHIIRYTRTDIVTKKPNGEIVLNTGGWQTQATKRKINEQLELILYPQKWQVFQKKKTWYLAEQDRKTIVPFFDGITISPNGVLPGHQNKTRKAIASRLADKLEDHFDGMCFEHINDLCQESFKSKEHINKILGLTDQNEFRHEFKVNMTLKDFNDMYPKTFDMLKEVADGKKFNIVDNTIEIDNRQKMRFTRYLSRNKTKVEQAKEKYGDSVCSELNIRSLDDLSVFRDKLKTKTCVISTNPYDMITSTEGSSYTSCFRFGGEYFNSTIALCRSPQVAIVYLYDTDRTRKIGRAWVYLFPDQKKFIMLKSYGSFYEAERKAVREAIEKQFSEHYKIKNKWVKSTIDSYDNVSGHTEPVYFDSHNVTFVRHKEANTEQEAIDLPEALCLFCGDDTIFEQGGGCHCCASGYTCEDCGHSVSDDERYSDDTYDYCSDCYHDRYFYCDSCHDYHSRDQENYVDGKGSFCEYCFNQKFHRCEGCNEAQTTDDYYVSELNQDVYCEECYYNTFTRCHDCDEEVYRDEAKKLDDEPYCEDCHRTECENRSESHDADEESEKSSSKPVQLELVSA